MMEELDSVRGTSSVGGQRGRVRARGGGVGGVSWGVGVPGQSRGQLRVVPAGGCWRLSYATAHSQHRFPAPFLEVIL